MAATSLQHPQGGLWIRQSLGGPHSSRTDATGPRTRVDGHPPDSSQRSIPRPPSPTSRCARESPRLLGRLANCWAALPQACKPCSGPALRPKEPPRDSDRDISDLLHRGSYTFEATSWSNTPPCAADGTRQPSLLLCGGRRLPVIGGIDVRWAPHLPGAG